MNTKRVFRLLSVSGLVLLMTEISFASRVRNLDTMPVVNVDAALERDPDKAAQTSANATEMDRNTGDRLLKKGLYDSVSVMLINESEMIKKSETENASVPQASAGPNEIQKLMYEGLDDVLDEKYKDAIPKLEKVIKEEPTYLSVWSTLGWTYWRAGRIDDAIALWKKLLKLDSDNPLPHALLGDAYVGTGELGKAEFHIKRSIELDPTRVDTRLTLGIIYRWTGRYQASIKLLQELLDEAPDRLDIQNELAMSLYHDGDYDKALPLLEQGVRADPDNRDLALAHMRCLLHTGNISEAELLAKRMLHEDGTDSQDMEVLLLLADAPRYKQVPEEAVPFLEKIARETDNPKVKKAVLQRLIELYVLLWKRDSEKYTLDKPIKAARELVDMDPDFMPWQETLSELLMMNTHYVNSEQAYKDVIKYGNTNSFRAHAGLCELYQAIKAFKKASKEFEVVKSLNPKNPYFYHMQGRMEMARANIAGAYDAADKLEAAGVHGAVAVLLYHGLSASDWDDSISARRFRLHMLALKQAGFKFLTPDQIEKYFEELPPPPARIEDYVPRRAVVVTFDNPTPKTLALATEVADDLDVRFAMNISVGMVEDGNLGDNGWALLRKYISTGRWVVGSMLYKASVLVPVTEDGILGSPLANRVWLGDEGEFESPLAFYKRLRNEYAQSRRILRDKLGKTNLVNFVAYPNGELGQGERSNVHDAIRKNLYESAVNYEVGFIQTEFGYAVNGDNALLYGRYAPLLEQSGDDVVEHVLANHPVEVARRMRIAIATLDGRLYRAVHGLELLRRDGYPARAYEDVEKFVYKNLPMRFGLAIQSEKSSRSEFDLQIGHPYFGAEVDWFRDSLHRRNWHTREKAGINITPALRVEARAGYGEFRQRYDENLAPADAAPILEEHQIKVKESFVGGRLGFRHNPKNKKRSPVSLVTGLEKHYYSGDADIDQWNYMADLAIRPFLPVDMRFQFEHDMVQSARSVADDVAYDMYGYNGSYLLRDWWQIWNNFFFYDVGDGNERFHAEVTSLWEVQEEMGLHFGLGYDYVDAKHYKVDYWTPYNLNEVWLVAKLRNNIAELYYDITLKYGLAHEDIRPEDEAAYRALVARGEYYHFDPGPAPDADWEDVWAASAALRKNIRRHLQAYGEASYTEAPDYHEYRTLAGLILIF